ncbi:MAG: type 4a pilus biogenesis protein PilO [Rhodanobacteraceae bacterium]|nr:type 4a pilus biogenesis protein PilO [Rhodanobacteraceae bacterium]
MSTLGRLLWRAACATAAILGTFAGSQLLQEAWHDFEAAERGVVERRMIFQEKQGRVGNLEPLKQQLGELRDVLRVLQQRLPSSLDEGEIQRALETRAARNGLRLDVVRRSSEVPKEFYVEQAFDLVLRGRATGVAAFLGDTATDVRVQTLRSLAMMLPPGADDLRTEVTFVYYHYPEEP